MAQHILQGTSEVRLKQNAVGAKVQVSPRWLDSVRSLAGTWHSKDSLLLLPLIDHVRILPMDAFRKHFYHNGTWSLRVWSEAISSEYFPMTGVFASPQDLRCSEAIDRAQGELARLLDSRTGFSSSGGRQFERAIKSILEGHGFSVDANVQTIAGEIDLMLTTFREGRASHVIIECKRRQSKVTLSQVARLHGVRDALTGCGNTQRAQLRR